MLDINIERLIDSSLIKAIKNNDRDNSHFHPSEFDHCHRKLVYKYYEAIGACTIAKNNLLAMDTRLQRIFDNGHSLHFRLGKNLEDTGYLKGIWECKKCRYEHGRNHKLGSLKPSSCNHNGCESSYFRYKELKFLDDETMMGGSIDAILCLHNFEMNGMLITDKDADEDSHMIVDFKSIRAESFKTLTAPKMNHITQMQIYFYLSGLKYGKFLYENKNDQMFREFLVERDETFIQEKVAQAKQLKRIATNINSNGQRILPPRAHKRENNKECVECAFRAHCWGKVS
jgi:hypothetical protein